MSTNNGFEFEPETKASDASGNNVYQNGNGNYSQMAEEIPQKKSFAQAFREYPKCVFFIFGNECCERFSFYGMKTVLFFYCTGILKFSDPDATALTNGFTSFCYYTPLLGCILADGYIGKFHTIMWVSLIYAAGNVVLAVASMKSSSVHPWLDIIGLALIGLGTGGIKPCVMSFGGDQFKKGQEKWLEQFFSIFYFMINLGSTVTTIVSPMFRVMDCLGERTCYPLAFGLPAILMVTAVALFAFGSFWYKKPKPAGNVFSKVGRVMIGAVKNKARFDIQREHWLYHYMDDHMCKHDDECKAAGKCSKDQFVKDIRAVLKVLVMFTPMPFFWALYDQSGTVWLVQGSTMKNFQVGSWTCLPDQMQVVNPILIMIFIPCFTYGIYPLMEKCIRLTPLRKMSIGGILAAISYIAMALIQYLVDPTLPVVPNSGMTRLEFVNYAACGLDVSITHSQGSTWHQLIQSNDSYKFTDKPAGDYTYTVSLGSNCSHIPEANYYTMSGSVQTTEQQAYYGIIAPVWNESVKAWELSIGASIGCLTKAGNGEGEFVVNFNYFLPLLDYSTATIQVCSMNASADNPSARCNTGSGQIFTAGYDASNVTTGSDFVTDGLAPGQWHVRLVFDQDKPTENNIYYGSFDIEDQGAIYALVLHGAKDLTDMEKQIGKIDHYVLATPNSVTIAWQFVPYVIISVAEIFLSITGYEFSYTQAPESMKSIILAGWLMTSAVGDDIIIGIAEAQLWTEMAYQYFFFGGLMFVVMIVFILMAMFYYDYTFHINEDNEETKQDVVTST